MNKVLKRIGNRRSGDGGASSTIEFLFAITFLLMLTITILDTGIYFANRTIVTNATQNGARLTSLYGGVGGSDRSGTAINAKYGTNSVSGCSTKGNSNPVTCSVEKELEKAPLVNVRLNKITCGPSSTTRLGERTWCEVSWKYTGIPGSGRSMMKRKSADTVTIMSAESEVIVR